MPVGHLVEAQQLLQQIQAIAAAPSPARLETSQGLLELALRHMQHLKEAASEKDFRPKPELKMALRSLRQQLRQTERLLEQAGLFLEGWLRLRAILTSGYDAHGNPAPAEELRRGLAEG